MILFWKHLPLRIVKMGSRQIVVEKEENYYERKETSACVSIPKSSLKVSSTSGCYLFYQIKERYRSLGHLKFLIAYLYLCLYIYNPMLMQKKKFSILSLVLTVFGGSKE